MVLICTTIDQDIVEKHQDKLEEEWGQSRVHGFLKGTRSTSQPKWHHHKLKVPEVCLKRCLELLSWLQQDLMKPCAKIKLGKPPCLSQLIQKIINQRYWIFALECDGVMLAVVNTKSPCLVFLFHQEYRRGEWTGTFLYQTRLQHFMDLFLNFIFDGG